MWLKEVLKAAWSEVKWLRTESNGCVTRFIMDVADWLNSICSMEILFPLISVGHWMYYNRCMYLNLVPHGSLQSPWSVSNLAFLIIAYRNVAWSIIPKIVCGWFGPRAVMTPGHSRRLSHGPPHTPSVLQYSCPMLSAGRELFQFKTIMKPNNVCICLCTRI
jgi:hypothetical protein